MPVAIASRSLMVMVKVALGLMSAAAMIASVPADRKSVV
jgi:hypothetical protein